MVTAAMKLKDAYSLAEKFIFKSRYIILPTKVCLVEAMVFSSSHVWMEKEMAIHSSVLAGRIPGMGDPGGLPSMGSHKVEHN